MGLVQTFLDMLQKEQPGVGDVHVAGGGKKGKGKKAQPFNAIMYGQAGDDDESVEAQTGATDDEADEEDGKPAKKFELTIDVAKYAPDQQRIFGWASVTHIDGKEVVDKQDEAIDLNHLENGAYDFVLNAREQGDMHFKRGVGALVESFVFTPEKAKLGITAKNDKGRDILGWWTGFEVTDPGVWADVKAGKRPEFSIGGRASSEPI